MACTTPPDEPAHSRRPLARLRSHAARAGASNSRLLGGTAHGLPGTPEPADLQDLGDILILAGKATESRLIVLVAERDGSVSCALPREEVGQGITTAVAMVIADG